MRDEKLIKALIWGLCTLLVLIGVVSIVAAACNPVRPEIVRGQAGADCDRARIITWAMIELGEAQTTFRLIGGAQMAAESGSPTNYGLASPEHVDFLTTMDCRYVAATVAHELTHVWEFRAIQNRGLYDWRGQYETEIVADCGSVLTGWEDYYPYLAERGYGCTGLELRAAITLREWAR